MIDLPRGATPIDFAYRPHTDVGHRCRGARWTGQLLPLNKPLESGQTVEIVTARRRRANIAPDSSAIPQGLRRHRPPGRGQHESAAGRKRLNSLLEGLLRSFPGNAARGADLAQHRQVGDGGFKRRSDVSAAGRGAKSAPGPCRPPSGCATAGRPARCAALRRSAVAE